MQSLVKFEGGGVRRNETLSCSERHPEAFGGLLSKSLSFIWGFYSPCQWKVYESQPARVGLQRV